MSSTVETASDIRPFHVDIPDEDLDDLRRRIAVTNWPEKETVADQSQGVPLAVIQELARYWMTDYDWRTCEANLNALPQFIAEIDGLDIDFIHVRSQHEDALPHGVDVADDGNGVLQDGRLYQLVTPARRGPRAGHWRSRSSNRRRGVRIHIRIARDGDTPDQPSTRGDAARSGGDARVPELAPIRHGRMLVSPFTFHRGAALVMAADLAGRPASGFAASTEECDAEIAVPQPCSGLRESK
jgi:hypothetical protein